MLAGSTVYGGVRPNYFPWNSFLLWYAVCFFILFFPFFVVDLTYAYEDNTCVGIRPIPNTNIHMSLRQWLQVDAYIMLAFILAFLLIGVLAYVFPEIVCHYGWWEGLHVFYIIFRLTWLIVGSVMFWRGLNNGNCAGRIRGYMWAMLIIGYIWLFVELFLAFGYPRPVLTPVSTPVVTPISTAAITPSPLYRPSSAIVV